MDSLQVALSGSSKSSSRSASPARPGGPPTSVSSAAPAGTPTPTGPQPPICISSAVAPSQLPLANSSSALPAKTRHARRSGEGSSGSGSSGGGGMSGSSSGKGRRRGGGGGSSGGEAAAGTPHLPRVGSTSGQPQQASPSQASLPLAPSPAPNVAPALPQSAAPTSNHGSQEEGMGLSGAEEDLQWRNYDLNGYHRRRLDFQNDDVYLPSVSYLTAPNGSGSGPGSSVGLVGDPGWPSPTPPPASSASIDDVDFTGSIAGGSLCTAAETPDAARTRAAIEHMQSKIRRTKELIRGEQTTSDDNVNEYLKLAANADKQQLPRIKAVFEKKNQKSAHAISQLQKKLEAYSRRVKDIEMHGLPAPHHRQPREVLRDMGQGLKHVGGNIRDGITGFSGTVMSKPREFAHLIKNKFGSADNINTLARNGGEGGIGTGGEDDGSGGGGGSGRGSGRTHHGSATLPGQGSSSSGAIGGVGKFPSEEEEGVTVGGDGSGGGGPLGGSECSSVTSESLPPPPHHGGHPCSPRHQHPTSYQLDLIFTELQERREECERLREEVETMKQRLQGEVAFLGQSLQEERFRSERLEEQVNDLTELHQVEVENLKQAISDVEEKVQYQSEERLRDIHEMLESCHTKIFKLEHQQQQQQQYVTLEGIENGNARALVVKLINVVLTVLQVVLLVVATAAGIMTPFLKTRLRILTTILFIASIVFVLKQWPEMREVGGHLVRRLRDALAVK